jgi:hypothetical protein
VKRNYSGISQSTHLSQEDKRFGSKLSISLAYFEDHSQEDKRFGSKLSISLASILRTTLKRTNDSAQNCPFPWLILRTTLKRTNDSVQNCPFPWLLFWGPLSVQDCPFLLLGCSNNGEVLYSIILVPSDSILSLSLTNIFGPPCIQLTRWRELLYCFQK